MVSVSTYGDGSILVSTLEAAKHVLGSGEFQSAVIITFLLGILFIAYSTFLGSFNTLNSLKSIISHYILLIIMFYALIVPKEDVLVVDQLSADPTSHAIVEDVPYGIAMMLWFTNVTERSLTSLFDTAFNMPFSYSQYGYNYYNMLFNAATEVKSENPYFNASFSNYVADCYFSDVLMGYKSLNNLMSSNNVWSDMAISQSNANLYTTIKCDPGESGNVCQSNGGTSATASVTCSTAYNYISNLLNSSATAAANQINKIIKDGASQLPVVVQTLMNVSATSEQLLKQAIVSNHLPDAYKNAIAMMSNSEVTQYSTALAEVQARQQMSTAGEMAKKYIPVIRWFLTGFVYGGFPLVILLAVTPFGPRALAGYLGLTVSQISWGPLYSILNNIIYSKTLSEFSYINGSIAPKYLTTIHNSTEAMLAMAGQIAWLIPVLTLSLGGIAFMGASRLISGMGAAAESAASAAGAQTSGLTGIKQTELAGYVKAASSGGYSMGDVVMSNAMYQSAFFGGMHAYGDPYSAGWVSGSLSSADTASEVLSGKYKTIAEANPARSAIASQSAHFNKARALGIDQRGLQQWEAQGARITAAMAKSLGLSNDIAARLDGARVVGGVSGLGVDSSGKLNAPLQAIKTDESGAVHTMTVGTDGQFYDNVTYTKDGQYLNAVMDEKGRISSGTVTGRFTDSNGTEMIGSLNITGDSFVFTGVNSKGEQLFATGKNPAGFNLSEFTRSNPVFPMQAEVFKVHGERTGPVQFGNVTLQNGHTVRDGGLIHGSSFIDNGELKQLINNKDFMSNFSKAGQQMLRDIAARGGSVSLAWTSDQSGNVSQASIIHEGKVVDTHAAVRDNSATYDTSTRVLGGLKKDTRDDVKDRGFGGGYTHWETSVDAQSARMLYNTLKDTQGADHPVTKIAGEIANFAEATNSPLQIAMDYDKNTGQVFGLKAYQHGQLVVGDEFLKYANYLSRQVGPHYSGRPVDTALEAIGLPNIVGDNVAYVPAGAAMGAGAAFLIQKTLAARAPLAATSSGTIIRSGSPLSRALPHLRALGKPLLMIGTSTAAVVGSVVLDPADNLVSQKDEETMLKQAKETGKKFNPEEQNKK